MCWGAEGAVDVLFCGLRVCSLAETVSGMNRGRCTSGVEAGCVGQSGVLQLEHQSEQKPDGIRSKTSPIFCSVIVASSV